jgi:hypothetical protein
MGIPGWASHWWEAIEVNAIEGIPLKGIHSREAIQGGRPDACAATVLHSTRPQQAVTTEALTVALKNRADVSGPLCLRSHDVLL